MGRPKRVSLKGKGAEIFFGETSPVETPPEAPASPPEPADSASVPALAQTSMPANQNDSLLANQIDGSRTHFPKATYRLAPEAIEAVDEAKRLLRRQLNIKTSQAEIVEQAILAAYQDLLHNQQTSMLANNLAGKQSRTTYGKTK